MQYLTSNHQPPPRLCNYGTGKVETQLLIDRGDTVTLAANDIYRHDEEPGTPSLGYNDWPDSPDADGIFLRMLKGTQADRDMVVNRAKWKRQAEWRKQQEAQKIIDSPDSDPSDKVRALQQLTGV